MVHQRVDHRRHQHRSRDLLLLNGFQHLSGIELGEHDEFAALDDRRDEEGGTRMRQRCAHQKLRMLGPLPLGELEWPEHPKFLMCTPLSHAGAAFFVPTIIKGGELVVLTKFDPAEVLKTIEEQKITATMLVPSMIYALMDHPDSHTRDLSSLETVYYGASAMNPVRLSEAIRRFGPIFAQYYGQSEAPMVITYLPKGDHDEKRLTSCGRPTVFARTALLDADGNQVPQGEVGEICVSGPLVSGGYWNKPEATAETFRDGWMHTGDLAREDEDGFWYIVDRTKDMIV